MFFCELVEQACTGTKFSLIGSQWIGTS